MEDSLVLVKGPYAVGGILHYRLHNDGVISYVGRVSYFGGLSFLGGKKGLTQEFEGLYQADPKSVLSASYGAKDAALTDYKVNMKVTGVENGFATVKAESPLEKADADIRVDISDHFARVHSAVVRGSVFGIPVSLEFSSERLANEEKEPSEAESKADSKGDSQDQIVDGGGMCR